ncbi:hypothetical protein BS78_07G136700 [Paspalum vaginatum]|nr:hypothetical protein BS78_07G136700 [Paspalum vaginatum]KAJ1268455.1 hypothetical protein BS78_07G136700 [Paspalum vaginatum]
MAMAMLPIKPLDCADGYLRWKESVLLRLHSADVAHVLFDDPPPAATTAAAAAAAKKWARDDAVCRGHILHALSDRIFPDYVRHATGRALWEAVARTYDLDSIFTLYERQLERFRHDFRFDRGTPLLEQLAHAEALASTGDCYSDSTVAHMICDKLPAGMATVIRFGDGGMTTRKIWKALRSQEEMRVQDEDERVREGEAAARVEQELDGKPGRRHHRRR